jgi:predicted nucleotidyltransferase
MSILYHVEAAYSALMAAAKDLENDSLIVQDEMKALAILIKDSEKNLDKISTLAWQIVERHRKRDLSFEGYQE